MPTVELPFAPYFSGGREEQLSPFLKPTARLWGINLSLKSSIVSAVLLALAFFSHLLGWGSPLTYLLLIFVYFLAGIPALIDSIKDLINLHINIDVLMTLAAFGSVMIGSPLEGALLLVLFALSEAMEETVSQRAKSSITALHKLAPTRAYVINDEGVTIEKALQEIKIHTKILVKAGQVIPLDGEILQGNSSINLVHLTGESIPINKGPGDHVPAGALNIDGALTLSVTHIASDSTLAKIIQLVTEAQEAKPELQQWFDKISKTYATTIIVLAILFAFVLPSLIQIPFLGREGSIYRALSFLIAASPCALIIAIPISYLSAISACARKGIVLKGGIILDALAKCKTIAFDKTGTLTTGNLVCLGFEKIALPEESMNLHSQEALAIAYSMEQNALHPIAKAITLHCEEKGAKPHLLKSFKSLPGQGLEGSADLHQKEVKIHLGNAEFILPKLSENSKIIVEKMTIEMRKNGELIAFLLIGSSLFVFRFSDTVRKEIDQTLKNLKEQGFRLLMLSGDHLQNAERVAKELHIDEVHAELKPEDKLNIIAKLSDEGSLAMVGDGVNDAPALARATVGISMGKVGSSAAIEAADVVLLQDNIERLDWLMRKASKTSLIVKQNLILATLAIIFASTPALAGLLPLWLAVIIHEGGTVLVGLNGLRLLRT